MEELSEEASLPHQIDLSKGTIELINDAIDEMEIAVNKEKLKTTIRELYVDSLSQ